MNQMLPIYVPGSTGHLNYFYEMKNMITVYDIYDIDNHEKILRVYTEIALAIVVVVLAQEMFNMQIQPVLIKADECE